MSQLASTSVLLHRIGTRLRIVAAPAAPAPARRRMRQRPRTALLWFAGIAVLVHLAALAALDAPWPNLRDPEYGMRVARLRARLAEHPGRPVALVVGSSRACMGIRPGAWEAVRSGGARDPLVFNFSTVGAGPIQQLIAVRRIFADGFRPEVVLLEYWPPLLRQDGKHNEQNRIDRRLRYDDLPVVQSYFPAPDRVEHVMLASRASPVYANRDRWLVRIVPNWLPPNQRADVTWREMDPWGWLPGLDVKPDDPITRNRFLDHYRGDFRERFEGFAIHPNSDRALRAAVAVVREHGARVGFIYLPEASEFRGWYPAEVETTAQKHFSALAAELGTPVIDARRWIADRYLADGHHLSRVGAAEFTPRLGPAISAAFPDLKREP
jgi:hypothetical protein